MKKALFLVLSVISLILVGCSPASSSNNKVVKLGVTGDDYEIWNMVKEKLKKDNIDLETYKFFRLYYTKYSFS